MGRALEFQIAPFKIATVPPAIAPAVSRKAPISLIVVLWRVQWAAPPGGPGAGEGAEGENQDDDLHGVAPRGQRTMGASGARRFPQNGYAPADHYPRELRYNP